MANDNDLFGNVLNDTTRLLAADNYFKARQLELHAAIQLNDSERIEAARAACVDAYESNLDILISTLITAYRGFNGSSEKS